MSDRSDNPYALVGPTGVAAGSGHFALALEGDALRVAAGRCYANGRMCVLEQAASLRFAADRLDGPGVYLIFVDAFEQDLIRADPSLVLGAAHGTADPFETGMRTLFQFRPLLLRDGEGRPMAELSGVDPRAFESGWRPPEPARGRLQARVPGEIRADALFRVEIHVGGAAADEILLKSSANNGMTASRLLRYWQAAGAHFLELESTTDDYPAGQSFCVGKWIEVAQRVSADELHSWLGTIVSTDATTLGVAWLGQAPPPGLSVRAGVLARQWDRVARARAGARVGLDADNGLNQIEVSLSLEDGEVFLPGDFWLLPASKEQNALLWPITGAAEDGFVGPGRPPDGIVRHYCPIGALKRTAGGWEGDVVSVLPQLETITQVATAIDLGGPSERRAPTEQAIVEYVEALRGGIDHRLQALREVVEVVQGPEPALGGVKVTGYRVQGSLKVGRGLAGSAGSMAGDLEVRGGIKDSRGDLMPVGSIIMWSGKVDAIPPGWALCDGQLGTPDLRSRFIVGAGRVGEYSSGASGDADDHTHGLNIPAKAATTSADGEHVHALPQVWRRNATFEVGGGTEVAGIDIRNTKPEDTPLRPGGNHSHSVSVPARSLETQSSSLSENRPKWWFALCFIMKR